jgi:predicted nucleic acid-binding protein
MIVVADACPIIFLAKLDRLSLIQDIFPGSILMPESVKRELVQDAIPFHERQRIEAFMNLCRIETVRTRQYAAQALSRADRHVLALASEHPRALILTDDSLVRRIALAEGRRVAGTLGLIIRAADAGLISKNDGRLALDALVGEHKLRVSVDLYQEALRRIET